MKRLDLAEAAPVKPPARWRLASISGAYPDMDQCGICGSRKLHTETVDVGVGHVPIAPEECLECGAQRLDWRHEYSDIERALGWSPSCHEPLPPYALTLEPVRANRQARFFHLDLGDGDIGRLWTEQFKRDLAKAREARRRLAPDFGAFSTEVPF